MSTAHPLVWHPALGHVSPDLRRWLQDRGSLTRRIQDRCSHFRVQPVFQALTKLYSDEQTVMGLRHHELAMVREVYLYCCDTPVVFAHSVVTRENLRGAWRGLNGLGNQSLGTVLFTNPKIKRTPLTYKKLSNSHILHERACQRLTTKPARLWARRSLFTLHGQSILVTEVFLPHILDLKK